eukprot:1604484-Amphidinium_carterae.1
MVQSIEHSRSSGDTPAMVGTPGIAVPNCARQGRSSNDSDAGANAEADTHCQSTILVVARLGVGQALLEMRRERLARNEPFEATDEAPALKRSSRQGSTKTPFSGAKANATHPIPTLDTAERGAGEAWLRRDSQIPEAKGWHETGINLQPPANDLSSIKDNIVKKRSKFGERTSSNILHAQPSTAHPNWHCLAKPLMCNMSWVHKNVAALWHDEVERASQSAKERRQDWPV